jgi:thymidylate kinase
MLDTTITPPSIERPTIPSLLLRTVFFTLNQANIEYCLLRGYDELCEGQKQEDIDLLVQQRDLIRMQQVLRPLGFVLIDRWGQQPHVFFVGYDPVADAWIKLDVVTELVYGSPVPFLRTELAKSCFNRRRKKNDIYVLSAEDEYVTVMLHCLLDKGKIRPRYQKRLAVLLDEIQDRRYLSTLFEQVFPPTIPPSSIEEHIRNGRWDALLELRLPVVTALAKVDPFGVRFRRIVRPLQRFLDRRTRSLRTKGVAVALLAPDGAGKTTLAMTLKDRFFLPGRYIYMGSNLTSTTLALPSTRWLAQIQGRLPNRVLRPLQAINSLLDMALRSRIGSYHRARGRLVIFDRFLARVMVRDRQSVAGYKRLQHWLIRKLCPMPDLVIFLDAPTDVLYERKPDHPPHLLENQRQHFISLLRDVPQKITIDASVDADLVRRVVTEKIWLYYTLHIDSDETARSLPGIS